jgi:hypothetical protein
MPKSWDRIVLTVILLVLMWPLVVTFFRIVVFDTRPSSIAQDVAAGPAPEKGLKPNEVVIDPTEPQALEYVVTRYAWAGIWPTLGKAGRFGLHKTSAAIGLCGTVVTIGAAIICIWFPIKLR